MVKTWLADMTEMWDRSKFLPKRTPEMFDHFTGIHSLPSATEKIQEFKINVLHVAMPVLNTSAGTSVLYATYAVNPTLLINPKA